VITAVVLAAGAGSRLGRPKALAVVDPPRTALEIVVATCAASLVDEVVVVAGARADEVVSIVSDAASRTTEVEVRCVVNARWEEGRTGSLQAGFAAVAAGSHVLVFPVDHPAVEIVTLDVILGVFGYAGAAPQVVVPVLLQDAIRRRGHPLVLGATLREAVAAMLSDEPLRDLVHRHQVLEVPVDDEAILLNVDTPEDLARARLLIASRRR